MTIRWSVQRGLLAVLLAFVVTATAGTAAAHAESAWWGLTSQPRPTYLKPAMSIPGRDEVQELTVGESAAFEIEVNGNSVGDFEAVPYPYKFVPHATAEDIQKALEAEVAYGPGNVEVAGGPGGTAPLVITTVKKRGGRSVAPIEVVALAGTAEAKVAVEAKAPVSSGETIVATVADIGDAQVSGQAVPITIADALPEGVEAYEVEAFAREGAGDEESAALSCSVASVSCSFSGAVEPYQVIEMFISVNVSPEARSGNNKVMVSGGETAQCKEVGAGQGAFGDSFCVVKTFKAGEPTGAYELEPIAGSAVAPSLLSLPVQISDDTVPFGLDQYEMTPEAEGGTTYGQAGGHPFQLSTTVVPNAGTETVEPERPGKGREFSVTQPGLPKNLTFKLPRGLIGNPTAYPECSEQQFSTFTNNSEDSNECPADAAVGVAIVSIAPPVTTVAVPVFNLVPEHGEPARFGFAVVKVPVILDVSVRTGGDYGVTVTTHNTSQTATLLSSQVFFWGDPGASVHRFSRGWGCTYASTPLYEDGACAKQAQPGGQPFLTMPTTCAANPAGEPLMSEAEGDSWSAFEVPSQTFAPIAATFRGASGKPLGLTGCNGLEFEPSIKATPDYEEASRPSGMSVNVHVPQNAGLNPNGVANSEVKQIKVELPQGVTLNPGGAGGLQACTGNPVDAPGTPGNEIGFKGANPEALGGLEYSERLPEPLEPGVNFCPKQSKIATVTIHTPLLPNPLEGAVYLATPDELGTAELNDNPFDSLIAMYLVAEDPISGTLVKLPMHVELNQTSGQVTTTVENPQLPFEDAELHFFGGGRAPLATPGLCGSYKTRATFTPWSGQEPVISESTFDVKSGPNGSACPSNPKPFAPEFNTGTVNNQAGAFSELRTTMGHPDVDQALGALTMTLPPGLMGSLSHVKLCGEPQAAEGTCGPESLIGHTTVTAGLGSEPAIVARPGDVYITGPYDGAPYGLSIANPAETGPFDLDKGSKCDCTVVRAKVQIDPHTAQITVTTPPPGSAGSIPTMLDGIPLDLQHIAVQIDRKEFMFNPTNCEKMAVNGTIASAEGASSPVASAFEAANCAALPFEPKFEVQTKAKHTRKGGAYLNVVVESKQGEAGLREVHVELPQALPSRLATLQKACTEAQFAANPAGCPAGSIVGHAEIETPVLPVPLKGPAYFVSHGGAKFPELIMVLQGYGTTIVLAGETFISKKGITSSTFKGTPDVPFNRFDLTLPAGEDSALAGDGNFCQKKLSMPTRLVAQSGKVLEQRTKVNVEGCKPEVRVLKRKVSGDRATLTVHVPSAGRLVASGKGIVRSVARSGKKGGGRVKLAVRLTAHARTLLAKRDGRRLRLTVKLRFHPTNGRAIRAHARLLM